MAIKEDKIAEELKKAIKKSHPKLMENEQLAEMLNQHADGFQATVAHFNKTYNAGIELSRTHVDSWVHNVHNSFDSVAKELAEINAESKKTGLSQEAQEKLAERETAAGEKALDAIVKSRNSNVRMLAKEFKLPEGLRQEITDRLGIEAKELEQAGAITRFFKTGEKLRMGRVTAVGLGAAAAGVGLGYLMSRDKKEEQPTAWTARVSAPQENPTQRGM